MAFVPPVLPVSDPGCTKNWEKLKSADLGAAPVPEVLTGMMFMWGGDTAPDGYVLGDGALHSKTTQAGLYAIFGDKYSYDGPFSTTFRVPDLRSRVPIGAGANPGLTTRALGDYGGSQDTPVVAHNHGTVTGFDGGHSHTVTDVSGTAVPGVQGGFAASGGATGVYVQDTSFGPYALATNFTGTHQHAIATDGVSGVGKNIQPFVVVNFIIKT